MIRHSEVLETIWRKLTCYISLPANQWQEKHIVKLQPLQQPLRWSHIMVHADSIMVVLHQQPRGHKTTIPEIYLLVNIRKRHSDLIAVQWSTFLAKQILCAHNPSGWTCTRDRLINYRLCGISIRTNERYTYKAAFHS